MQASFGIEPSDDLKAELDIAKRHLPKDGRIQIKLGEKYVDLRVSTFPTINGEKLVLRILDKSKAVLCMAKFGLSTENLRKFRTLIKRPYGLLLITGPTGSGKTSTLYAAPRH